PSLEPTHVSINLLPELQVGPASLAGPDGAARRAAPTSSGENAAARLGLSASFPLSDRNSRGACALRALKGFPHETAPWFDPDRVAGGDRHHRRADWPALAGRAENPRGRPAAFLYQQPQTTWPGPTQPSFQPGEVPAGSWHLADRLLTASPLAALRR